MCHRNASVIAKPLVVAAGRNKDADIHGQSHQAIRLVEEFLFHKQADVSKALGTSRVVEFNGTTRTLEP